MRLESFELANFKSYSHARLQFQEGFNLLTGRNNAGKSALLEALSGNYPPTLTEACRQSHRRGVPSIPTASLR